MTAADRIAGSLKIRPGEGQLVLLMGALFLLAEAGRGLALNSADALFFLRFGVENLPWMYISLGLLSFLLIIGYTAGLARFNLSSFVLLQFLGIAGTVLAERAMLVLDVPLLYPILWLTINVFTTLLWTSLWSIASEVCDARQAKRLFPLFASASILGGVIGNFLTGALAQALGTENLLILYPLLLVLAAIVLQVGRRRVYRSRASQDPEEGFLASMLAGLRYVRHAPLLRLVTAASVLFSVLFFSVAFSFSRVVTANFPDETSVAGFLGLFSGVVTSVTFLVSLLLASRVYARIGVVNVVLLVAVFYLAAFGIWSSSLTLTTAAAARFFQIVLINGLGVTAWNALYNVFPTERRSQLKAFESGVPMQLGIVLSGVFLLAREEMGGDRQVFLVAAGISALLSLIVRRMRAAYGAALVNALRVGIVDVYTAATRDLFELAADAQARRTALLGVKDDRPSVRRVSAEVLGKLGVVEGIDDLISALADTDSGVRAVALESLALLRAVEAESSIRGRVRDEDAGVRAAAVDALADLDSPLADWADAALSDPDVRVRARAAVALHRAGRQGRAWDELRRLLQSAETTDRVVALEALVECRIQAPLESLEACARDSDPNVRAAALPALGMLTAYDPVFSALDDEDERVRQSAARVLQAAHGQLGRLVHGLESGSERVQDAVLLALAGHGLEAREALVEWAVSQMPRVAALRERAAALSRSTEAGRTQAIAYLRHLLQRRKERLEQRLLRALALLGERRAMELIARGLRRGDRETRAQALEALDTLADKRVVRGLLPLLEEQAEVAGHPDTRALLHDLAKDPDAWVRALAIHALSDLLQEDLRSVLHRAAEDPEPIVRHAVVIPGELNGVAMAETSKTLNTMDRILFLQQVSVFEDLEPEDLYPIADIAIEKLFPVGDYLCREGEVSDEMFVIVEGQVKVYKEHDGTVRILRRLTTGEHVGELAVLAEQPRSATVQADDSEVRALVIEGRAIQSILRDRPQAAMAMLATLAKRMSTQG